MCPRPARILVHSVMNGRGIWFLCRSVRCAPPPLNWSCIPVPIVQRLLVCCPWRSRVPAYVCGSMRACAGGRSVPLVGANRFDFILPVGGAGVPLLRCAARRRVRIGCVVSPVPLRCPAGAPLAAVLCLLAPRIFVAGSGRAVVAVCAQTRQLRVPSPPCVRCSSRRRCHWFCPAGSPPYALCVLKWAFWRVWRGVGVYIAMSRGRALWLH